MTDEITPAALARLARALWPDVPVSEILAKGPTIFFKNETVKCWLPSERAEHAIMIVEAFCARPECHVEIYYGGENAGVWLYEDDDEWAREGSSATLPAAITQAALAWLDARETA